MGKVRRGNHVFVSWVGDHGHHVHVYKDNKLIVKWDLDEWKAIKGKGSRRLLKLILELLHEGKI